MKNCTRRKSEYRIHEVLPNGQHLNLFFKRHKSDDPEYPFFQLGGRSMYFKQPERSQQLEEEQSQETKRPIVVWQEKQPP